MKQLILIYALLSCLTTYARQWTATNGKTVDADIVKLNHDRSVTLRKRDGKTLTVPFGSFSAEDVAFLDELMDAGLNKPHALLREEINALFGMKIWSDYNLWDDPTTEAGERMRLHPESKTDFMENLRAYPLGKEKILGEPIYTAALYGNEKHVTSISLVFLNQGDMPTPKGTISPDVIKAMADEIEACGMRIRSRLEAVLGEARRDSLGKGPLQEKVWRWDWNGHTILLTMQEGKYAAIRIMPPERADRAGRVEKVKALELKKRMAAQVERRDNGDVIIKNIPMIDQGPKGYCVPATWERYFRYMDIPVDMYLLALAANTSIGGGTTIEGIIQAVGGLASANGREIKATRSSLQIGELAEYINVGLPVMWIFETDAKLQQLIQETTAKRNGQTIKKTKQNQTQEDNFGSAGHICLIIGYNEKTKELAISDSWGKNYTERWLPAHSASKASYPSGSNIFIIKW